MQENQEAPMQFIQIDTPGDDNTYKLNEYLCQGDCMSDKEQDIIKKGIKTANELIDQAYDVGELTQIFGGLDIEEGSELFIGLNVLAKEGAENYNKRIMDYLAKNSENHKELRIALHGLGFANWTITNAELINTLKSAAKRA